jgi:hypothetical protein
MPEDVFEVQELTLKVEGELECIAQNDWTGIISCNPAELVVQPLRVVPHDC